MRTDITTWSREKVEAELELAYDKLEDQREAIESLRNDRDLFARMVVYLVSSIRLKLSLMTVAERLLRVVVDKTGIGKEVLNGRLYDCRSSRPGD